MPHTPHARRSLSPSLRNSMAAMHTACLTCSQARARVRHSVPQLDTCRVNACVWAAARGLLVCACVCVCTHTHEHGCSRDRWGVRVHAGDLDIVLMPCTVSGTGGLCPRVLKPSWLVSWLAGIARKCGVCIGMASRCGEMMRHGQLAAHAARTRGSGYGALRSRRAFCCARQHPTASFTSSQ